MTRTLLIITLCVVGAAPVYGSDKHDSTVVKLRQLSEACNIFREEYKQFPPQDSWLAELQATDEAVINHRRILSIKLDNGLDAWGNAFVYRCPGRHNPGAFDLYSLGADGKTETDGDDPDDISNWHEPERWRKHYYRPAISTTQAIFIAGIVISILILLRPLRRKQQS
jgi:hypothetical protein